MGNIRIQNNSREWNSIYECNNDMQASNKRDKERTYQFSSQHVYRGHLNAVYGLIVFLQSRLEFGHYQQFPSQVLPERHIQKAVQKMLRCMLKESRLIWVFDSYGKTQVQSRRDGRINQNEKVDRPTWERNQL